MNQNDTCMYDPIFLIAQTFSRYGFSGLAFTAHSYSERLSARVVVWQTHLTHCKSGSVSNTRGHQRGSAPPLVLILRSRNQRANCPSAKKLIGQIATGRIAIGVTISEYQPHGGWLRKGYDRLSGRNSSITRTARDCESGESLGRKWCRVA